MVSEAQLRATFSFTTANIFYWGVVGKEEEKDGQRNSCCGGTQRHLDLSTSLRRHKKAFLL